MTNYITLIGASLALSAALVAVGFARHEDVAVASRQQASAFGLLAVHESSKKVALANSALTGAIPVASLNVATGFNRLYGSDVLNNAVRTWVLPTEFTAEQRDVLVAATDLHYGSVNIGVVLPTGGWQAVTATAPQGNAALTAGIPAGAVMVYSKIR